MGIGNDRGGLADRKGRRHWRRSGWGLGTTVETKRLGTEDDSVDLDDGDSERRWRLGC